EQQAGRPPQDLAAELQAARRSVFPALWRDPVRAAAGVDLSGVRRDAGAGGARRRQQGARQDVGERRAREERRARAESRASQEAGRQVKRPALSDHLPGEATWLTRKVKVPPATAANRTASGWASRCTAAKASAPAASSSGSAARGSIPAGTSGGGGMI